MKIEREGNFLWESDEEQTWNGKPLNRWSAQVSPNNGIATAEGCEQIAKLFAAAPQLLEACEELAGLYAEAIGEECQNSGCECVGCAALARARAAIRAAREVK